MAVLGLGLTSCEKSVDSTPGDPSLLFWFRLYDSNGNNIYEAEDFCKEDVTLEYDGKIYQFSEYWQGGDESIRESGWGNGFKFFYNDRQINKGFPAFSEFRIAQIPRENYQSSFIIRYKDNEWNVEANWDLEEADKAHVYHQHPIKVLVNGKITDSIFVGNAPDDFSTEVWLYPLYIE